MFSTKWPGTSALIKWVLPASFLASLVAWALGIAFTVQAANLDVYDGRRVSNATIYFYTCGLPMATTLAALIDLVLYNRGRLFPVASIIWGVVAWGAWLFVITIWSACEFSPDGGSGGVCPEFYYYRTSLYGTGLWVGRLTAGSIAAVGALTQMALGARAVDLGRRERRKERRKERNDKRSFELENVA